MKKRETLKRGHLFVVVPILLHWARGRGTSNKTIHIEIVFKLYFKTGQRRLQLKEWFGKSSDSDQP